MTQNVRARGLYVLHGAHQTRQVLTNLTAIGPPTARPNEQSRHPVRTLRNPLRAPLRNPTVEGFESRRSQRNHPLLVTLTQHTHRLIHAVDALQVQAGEFGDTHSGGVENLNNSLQAQQTRVQGILSPLPLNVFDELTHLVPAEHERQVALTLGGAHTAHRVGLHELFLLCPGKKGSQGRTPTGHG